MNKKIVIICNRCRWELDHQVYWKCSCHHVWNVFETKGLCPECDTFWNLIQCPNCFFPLFIKEWYGIRVDWWSLYLKRRNLVDENKILWSWFLQTQGHGVPIVIMRGWLHRIHICHYRPLLPSPSPIEKERYFSTMPNFLS